MNHKCIIICTLLCVCKYLFTHDWLYDFMCNFRCVCPEGFEGDMCEINIDDCEDNDCENNSTCVDGINNYTCMCSPEYTGNTLLSKSFLPQWISIYLFF